MRGVSIIGVGITPFGVRAESLVALGAIACRDALEDAGLEPERIEAFFLGNFAGQAFVGQNHIAPMVAHATGLGAVPCTRLEGACASGGLAMRQGVLAVASGQVDFALIAGVEKMTSAETDETASILAAAGDVAVEERVGSTFPALFGLIARRHMHEHGTTREEIAHVAVKNHAHGKLNPNAHRSWTPSPSPIRSGFLIVRSSATGRRPSCCVRPNWLLRITKNPSGFSHRRRLRILPRSPTNTTLRRSTPRKRRGRRPSPRRG